MGEAQPGVTLAPMSARDWPEVRRIYVEGIRTGHATFETEPPEWESWDAGHLASPRFVAQLGDRVVGWAALTPVSGRCVYAGVAEVSVYVDASARGHGVGRLLLEALVTASEEAGLWTLTAGIFPENEASVRLHRGLGFREVGRRERIGKLHGVWRDTLLMERRSGVVGVE